VIEAVLDKAAFDGCTRGALDGSGGDAFAAAAFKSCRCCTLAPKTEGASEDGCTGAIAALGGAGAAVDRCNSFKFKLCGGVGGGAAGAEAAFDLCKEGKIAFKLCCCRLDGGPDDAAAPCELDIPFEIKEFNEGGGGRLLIVILLFNI